MANIDRVKKAIAVMTRVRDRGDKLNMEVWQERSGLHIIGTEKRLHTCGTAACFAGWLAVSPEFQEDGGGIAGDGSPLFENEYGTEAIAAYLEIHQALADLLCAATPSIEADLLCAATPSIEADLVFYDVGKLDDITPQMIVDKLQRLIDNG